MPTPWSRLDRVLEWNRRPGARVRLAGDYFGALGGTAEAAAELGLRAPATVSHGPSPVQAAAGQASRERGVAAYRETGRKQWLRRVRRGIWPAVAGARGSSRSISAPRRRARSRPCAVPS